MIKSHISRLTRVLQSKQCAITLIVSQAAFFPYTILLEFCHIVFQTVSFTVSCQHIVLELHLHLHIATQSFFAGFIKTCKRYFIVKIVVGLVVSIVKSQFFPRLVTIGIEEWNPVETIFQFVQIVGNGGNDISGM